LEKAICRGLRRIRVLGFGCNVILLIEGRGRKAVGAAQVDAGPLWLVGPADLTMVFCLGLVVCGREEDVERDRIRGDSAEDLAAKSLAGDLHALASPMVWRKSGGAHLV
jgi:hypothetical protein